MSSLARATSRESSRDFTSMSLDTSRPGALGSSGMASGGSPSEPSEPTRWRRFWRVTQSSGAANAKRLLSAKTTAAIENLARSDRRVAATPEIWNAEPWLLNTPGGTVDLRTGNMLPHDPLRYLTKISAVAPGGDCPRWLQFLDEITDGDAELQSFLQRMAGYALTGSTQEHALFFAYGTGANGKGVLINTVAA